MRFTASKGAQLRSSESGVSMVELALILPVVILLIVGLIDYGMALHEIQVISAAARNGARAGSAHPRTARGEAVQATGSPAINCINENEPQSSIRCGEVTQSSLNSISYADSAVNVAKKTACASLNGAGSPGSLWNVRASIKCPTEDGSRFQMMRVVIEREAGKKSCIFCLEERLAALRPRADTTFLMELECLPLPPAGCEP